MRRVQEVLDRLAEPVPVEALARSFLAFERWNGDEPRLLAAEAAAATTGQRFVEGIVPAVTRFRDAFVESGRIESFTDLAALECDDDDLVAALGAKRKRYVLLEIAAVLADRPEADDLAALRGWAADADHYRYEHDPIGAITGVGPKSFQYLRQLAGVPAVSPDATVASFVEAVDAELEVSPLETATPRLTIAACEWLAIHSSYDMLELDRIAWWRGTEPADRAATLEASDVDV